VLRLPDYEVVIHISVNEFSAALAREIETIAKNFELDESTEHDGRRDYHWTFKSWDDSVAAGEKFKHPVSNPNLLMLRVKTNYDLTIKPISHKDLIRPKKIANDHTEND
jgi:hypothetical protein